METVVEMFEFHMLTDGRVLHKVPSFWGREAEPGMTELVVALPIFKSNRLASEWLR
jgi:hypothetical protein